MMKNCQENEGLTNSSRLRIRLQRNDECQNWLEIASNAKKWKEYIILPVQETYLNEMSFILFELACKYCGLLAKV
jgi:hypothetical protein